MQYDVLLDLQGEACNFTKSNAPPWMFFTFFKLYKWHQIQQIGSYKGLASCRVKEDLRCGNSQREVSCYPLQLRLK